MRRQEEKTVNNHKSGNKTGVSATSNFLKRKFSKNMKKKLFQRVEDEESTFFDLEFSRDVTQSNAVKISQSVLLC